MSPEPDPGENHPGAADRACEAGPRKDGALAAALFSAQGRLPGVGPADWPPQPGQGAPARERLPGKGDTEPHAPSRFPHRGRASARTRRNRVVPRSAPHARTPFSPRSPVPGKSMATWRGAFFFGSFAGATSRAGDLTVRQKSPPAPPKATAEPGGRSALDPQGSNRAA